MNLFVFMIFCSSLFGISHAVNPGLVVSVGKVVLDTVQFINALSGPAVGDGSGQFLYAKYNRGCLATGMEVPDDAFAVYANRNCPPDPNFKWKFDGELLQVESQKSISGKACLDCRSGKLRCYLEVTKCNGEEKQRFQVRIHPRQIDLENRKVYFSIHSSLNTSWCLDNNSGRTFWSKYRGKNCRGIYEPSHVPPMVTVSGGESLVTIKFIGNQCETPNTIMSECTGSDSQSFYLAANYFHLVRQVTSVHLNGSVILQPP